MKWSFFTVDALTNVFNPKSIAVSFVPSLFMESAMWQPPKAMNSARKIDITDVTFAAKP